MTKLILVVSEITIRRSRRQLEKIDISGIRTENIADQTSQTIN